MTPCGDCQMRTADEHCREEGTGASVNYRPLPAPGMRHRDCVYDRHRTTTDEYAEQFVLDGGQR